MPILKTCNNCKHYDDFGNLCVRGKELSSYDPVTGNEEFFESTWVRMDCNYYSEWS